MDDISQILTELESFREERDWKQFHHLHQLAAAISIEAAELQELFLWKTEDEIRANLQEDAFRQKISDEVADILIFALYILKDIDVDPRDVIAEKIRKNKKKYPVDLASGKSTKYTDL